MRCSRIIFPVWAVVGAFFVAGAHSAEEQAPANASHLSVYEKEEFLYTADVVRMEKLSEGVTGSSRATLSKGSLTHDAHVQTVQDQAQHSRDRRRGESHQTATSPCAQHEHDRKQRSKHQLRNEVAHFPLARAEHAELAAQRQVRDLENEIDA